MWSNSIETWSLRDEHAQFSLEDIGPLSARAKSLICRSKDSAALKVGFINVLGAAEMMGGLDYHHSQFSDAVKSLARGEIGLESNLRHESIAYLNRLGQFSKFCRSKFVRDSVPIVTVNFSAIEKFLIFRDKHGAHRSIDDPRGETEEQKLLDAMSMSGVYRMFAPRPEIPVATRASLTDVNSVEEMKEFERRQWTESYFVFQIFDERRQAHLTFALEEEHPDIMSAAYSVIDQICCRHS